jgi:ribonuclease P protein component
MSPCGFPKAEHLCGKNNFQQLFKEGEVCFAPSFKLVCRKVAATSFGIQAGMVVPKRILRHAVDRNRVKRLLREAYRLNKSALYATLGADCCQWQLLFVYTGHRLPTFIQVQKSVNALLSKMQTIHFRDVVKKNGAD